MLCAQRHATTFPSPPARTPRPPRSPAALPPRPAVFPTLVLSSSLRSSCGLSRSWFCTNSSSISSQSLTRSSLSRRSLHLAVGVMVGSLLPSAEAVSRLRRRGAGQQRAETLLSERKACRDSAPPSAQGSAGRRREEPAPPALTASASCPRAAAAPAARTSSSFPARHEQGACGGPRPPAGGAGGAPEGRSSAQLCLLRGGCVGPPGRPAPPLGPLITPPGCAGAGRARSWAWRPWAGDAAPGRPSYPPQGPPAAPRRGWTGPGPYGCAACCGRVAVMAGGDGEGCAVGLWPANVASGHSDQGLLLDF